MQKYSIKIKTFFINYCVLDLSKICINSCRRSFQLAGGDSLHINSLRVRHIQNIPQFFIIIHNNCSTLHKALSLGNAESISESLIFVPWFWPTDNSVQRNNSSGLPGIVSCLVLLIKTNFQFLCLQLKKNSDEHALIPAVYLQPLIHFLFRSQSVAVLNKPLTRL